MEFKLNGGSRQYPISALLIFVVVCSKKFANNLLLLSGHTYVILMYAYHSPIP